MRGKYRALWLDEDGFLNVIDQRALPFEKRVLKIDSAALAAEAIKKMIVRGAGVIGNCAAFGIYLSSLENGGDLAKIESDAYIIKNTRPTAVNLSWAVDRMVKKAKETTITERTEVLKEEAIKICDEDALSCKKIGETGADLIEEMMRQNNKESIDILTHCNAGWLAIVDDGSALAPIYELHRRGVRVHVWVDETRPRNQGSNLTSWELSQEGVDHTLIVDNTGGLLMSRKMVDLCIVGADRVAANGDVANKIGTYLKALAAKDNNIPFFVALPLSTFDLETQKGSDIPIEIRSETELSHMKGLDENGRLQEIRIYPENAKALNYGFDITPAKLVTMLLTPKGACKPNTNSISRLFNE